MNALSSFFEIVNYRKKENTCHTIAFENGVKIADETTKLTKAKSHGARITFSPSRLYLGENAHIPVEEVEDWLERISYLLPPWRKIKIDFSVTNGLADMKNVTFKSRAFSDILERDYRLKKDDALTKKVSFQGTGYIDETIGSEVKKKRLDLDVVFTYVDPLSEGLVTDNYVSYCNFTHTTMGGVHEETVDECLCRFFVPKVRASLNNREKDTLDIKWDDVRTGLYCAINLSTNAQVDFQGNMKEEIGNKNLVSPIKEIVNHELETYFATHEEQLKQILKIIKINAKVRIEANKVRTKVAKSSLGKWNRHEISNFRDVQKLPGKKKEEKPPLELFIIEGEKSAMGTAVDARDPEYQAIYGVRGMTKNPYTVKLHEMLDPKNGNREWVNYETVLDCGHGKDFDINRLKWDKIIIMSDADIDGSGITVSVAGYHMLVHPEIVEAGRLYRVLPPLYAMGKRKDEQTFARDKRERIDIDFKEIGKHMTFTIRGEKKPMSKDEMKTFLMDTYYYLGSLVHAAKHYQVDKFFLERIVAFIARTVPVVNEQLDLESLMQDQRFRTNMISFIQETYPEITLVGTDSLRGIVNFHNQSIQITNRFVENTLDLYEPIQKYRDILTVTDRNSEPIEMSIGQAMEVSQNYAVNVLGRYKGLGEMNASELWETTMNPETRVLVRLTSEDLKREMEVFQMLNGNRKKDLEGRKKLVRGKKVRMEDLDG